MTTPSLFNGRYARQIAVREIGPDGQRRLAAASVLIVGCGALGGAQAELLARMGIGRLRLVDRDVVEPGNLPRQLLYDERDAAEGTPKALAAANRLRAINSQLVLDARPANAAADTIEGLLEGMDLVLDGTDNVETRYLLNDACVKHGKPWVHGGVAGTVGIVLPVMPNSGPCLRCLFPTPPPAAEVRTCATDGVLNTAVVQVASQQVTFACKIILGQPVAGSLLHVDAWAQTSRLARLRPVPDCPCCQRRDFTFLESDTLPLASAVCGRDTVRVSARVWNEFQLTPDALPRQFRQAGLTVTAKGLLTEILADHRRFTLFPDGTLMVHACTDPAAALDAVAHLARHAPPLNRSTP